jgi:parvulin-like peptidyl-prolyl isomerase
MRQQIRERIMFEALRDKNINVAVFISPREIQNYYQAHTNDFFIEETVHLRMIVVDSSATPDAAGRRKMAAEILAKIKDGASFTEMAGIYSSGSQKREGGDWGWVKKSVLRSELADVAFTLSTNQPSNVIETPETCYIMKVEERRPAHVSPLSEVQEEIEKTLLVQERAFYQKRYVERLRKKTFVRYF